jgi:hypothetical protein
MDVPVDATFEDSGADRIKSFGIAATLNEGQIFHAFCQRSSLLQLISASRGHHRKAAHSLEAFGQPLPIGAPRPSFGVDAVVIRIRSPARKWRGGTGRLNAPFL